MNTIERQINLTLCAGQARSQPRWSAAIVTPMWDTNADRT
jgi:hypothetical protein